MRNHGHAKDAASARVVLEQVDLRLRRGARAGGGAAESSEPRRARGAVTARSDPESDGPRIVRLYQLIA